MDVLIDQATQAANAYARQRAAELLHATNVGRQRQGESPILDDLAVAMLFRAMDAGISGADLKLLSLIHI